MASHTIDFSARGVTLEKQKELAWCYAAVVSIVSHWLTNNHGWKPCQIVATNMEEKMELSGQPDTTKKAACNCCAKNKPSACTGVFAVGKLSDTLNRLNIIYATTAGMPTSQSIAQEINANRPVLVGLSRKDGGAGHVAMIIGYDDAQRPGDDDRTDMLTLFDPAAQNIPFFNGRVNISNMTLKLTMAELYAKYPTPKYEVSRSYSNLALGGGGMTAPPAWTTFEL